MPYEYFDLDRHFKIPKVHYHNRIHKRIPRKLKKRIKKEYWLRHHYKNHDLRTVLNVCRIQWNPAHDSFIRKCFLDDLDRREFLRPPKRVEISNPELVRFHRHKLLYTVP